MKNSKKIILIWILIVVLIFVICHLRYKNYYEDSEELTQIMKEANIHLQDNLDINVDVVDKWVEPLNDYETELLLRFLLIEKNDLMKSSSFINYYRRNTISKLGMYSLMGGICWENGQKEDAHYYYLKARHFIRNKMFSLAIIRLKRFPEGEYAIFVIYTRLKEYEISKGNYSKANEYDEELSYILD
ncbi:MAG: hypothetical protein ACLFPF_05340 [Halanaerobiales bacterium]